MPAMTEKKRVVVWGTGFVGKMVIPEVAAAPRLRAGRRRGVNDKDKVGRDVGEICGIGSVGITATDDLDALVALRPDALVHYGPDGRPGRRQHPRHGRVPAGRHRRVLDGHDPVGVAPHDAEPTLVDRPHHRGVRRGRRHVLHHRHRPGLRQRPVPHDPDGPVRRGAEGAGARDPRLHQLQGDYEDEMGIGRPPEFIPLLEHTDILVMSWGGDRADDGPRRRASSSTRSPPRGRSGCTDTPITTAKGVIKPGKVAAIHFTINGIVPGRAPHLPRAHQPGRHRTPRRTGPGATRTTSTGSRSRARRRSPRRRPSASPTAAAATPPRPAAWPPGCGPSTPCPPSTTCRPGGPPPWTCRSSPGSGTIR